LKRADAVKWISRLLTNCDIPHHKQYEILRDMMDSLEYEMDGYWEEEESIEGV
jgi:hypothetical protein